MLDTVTVPGQEHCVLGVKLAKHTLKLTSEFLEDTSVISHEWNKVYVIVASVKFNDRKQLLRNYQVIQ